VNKYALGVVFVVFGTLTVSFMVGLIYSQAVLVFGLASALAAPVVIHKVPNANIAPGLFVGLTLFASFPFRKLFKIDGMVEELAVNFAYAAVLWIVGFGWKRIWPKAKFWCPDDAWWKHRIAVLWRASVGVTLCKPKTRGETLSGNRAARLVTARPEDGLKTLLWSVFTVRLPEGFSPQARG
jgi:hypothetical protein